MEILSFEGGSSNSPRKKKSLKVVLGLSVIAGVAVFGSTLAASVTINSGSAFQFGQGIVQATACDSAITVSATSAFTNASGAGSFKLNTVTLSGIASTCDSKNFKIVAWDDNGASALTIAGTSTSIVSAYNNTTPASSTVSTPSTAGQVTVSSSGAGSVTYTVATPVLDASTVYKLTIEEQ